MTEPTVSQQKTLTAIAVVLFIVSIVAVGASLIVPAGNLDLAMIIIAVLWAGLIFTFGYYRRRALGLPPLVRMELAPAIDPKMACRRVLRVIGVMAMLVVASALIGVLPNPQVKRLYLVVLLGLLGVSFRHLQVLGMQQLPAWQQSNRFQVYLYITMLFGSAGVMVAFFDWVGDWHWSLWGSMLLFPPCLLILFRWLRRQTPPPRWHDWLRFVGIVSVMLSFAPLGIAGVIWWLAVGLRPLPEPAPIPAMYCEETAATRQTDAFIADVVREVRQLPVFLSDPDNSASARVRNGLVLHAQRLRWFRTRFAALSSLAHIPQHLPTHPPSYDDPTKLICFFNAVGKEAEYAAEDGNLTVAADRAQFLIERGYVCVTARPTGDWLYLVGLSGLRRGARATAAWLRAAPPDAAVPDDLRTAIIRYAADPAIGWHEFVWSEHWCRRRLLALLDDGNFIDEGFLKKWVFKHYGQIIAIDFQLMACNLERQTQELLRWGEGSYPQVSRMASNANRTAASPVPFWQASTNTVGSLMLDNMSFDNKTRVQLLNAREMTRGMYRALNAALQLRDARRAGRDPHAAWSALSNEERTNPLTGQELAVDWQAHTVTLAVPTGARTTDIKESQTCNW